MDYEIRVVEDHELPAQTPWVCVNSGPDHFMLVKRSLGEAPGGWLSALVERTTGELCPRKRGMGCPVGTSLPSAAVAV